MSEKNGMLFLVIAVLVVGAILISVFRVSMPELFDQVTAKMKSIIGETNSGGPTVPGE